MSISDSSLAGSVRAVAREERRQLDTHPTPGELLDYHAGRISTADRERVQDHLALCRVCAKAVLDIETFPDLEPVDDERLLSDHQVAAERRAIEDRVREEHDLGQLLPFRRATRAAAHRPAYALAAALATACLGLLVWNHSLRQTALLRSEPQANVPATSLSARDSPGERGAGGDEVAHIQAEQANVLFLPYIATEPSASDLLALELRDGTGEVVWRQGGLKSDPTRGLNLMLPDDFLSPGEYHIQLYRREDHDRKLVKEYSFSVI